MSTPNSKGRRDTEVLFSSVLEICFDAVARRRAYYIATDSILAYLLSELRSPGLADTISLSPDSLALRATIGLIDLFGLALLVGCLPLPLSLRRATPAFSGYRAVLGTRSLHIPVILLCWCFTTRHVFRFLPIGWNEGCWGVYIRTSVVSSIGKTNQSRRRLSYRWSYMLGLSTTAEAH